MKALREDQMPVELYRMRVLEKALKLQLMRGSTAYARVKAQFKFKGTPRQVLVQLQELIKEKEAQL